MDNLEHAIFEMTPAQTDKAVEIVRDFQDRAESRKRKPRKTQAEKHQEYIIETANGPLPETFETVQDFMTLRSILTATLESKLDTFYRQMLWDLLTVESEISIFDTRTPFGIKSTKEHAYKTRRWIELGRIADKRNVERDGQK